MRPIIVQEFLTLDGVMQAPGRPDEDTTDGFAFGGWTAPYFAEADAAAGEFMSKHLTPTDLLLGRWTYEMCRLLATACRRLAWHPRRHQVRCQRHARRGAGCRVRLGQLAVAAQRC